MTASVPEDFDAYAEGRSDARFTDWLRARAEPAWSEATDHRFARELGTGEIDDAVFRRYLVQDYAFVETLVGAFGHAVGEAPTMAAKGRLTGFLDVLTDEENDYFERAFDALDVPATAYRDPRQTDATESLADLLERSAREGGYAESLAVLAAAEWVYLTWAQAVADGDAEAFYHVEWVDLHASDSFASFVEWLRTELDREGTAASERRQRKLARLFRRTVELELAFFEAAYETDPVPDRVGPDREGSPDGGGGA